MQIQMREEEKECCCVVLELEVSVRMYVCVFIY